MGLKNLRAKQLRDHTGNRTTKYSPPLQSTAQFLGTGHCSLNRPRRMLQQAVAVRLNSQLIEATARGGVGWVTTHRFSERPGMIGRRGISRCPETCERCHTEKESRIPQSLSFRAAERGTSLKKRWVPAPLPPILRPFPAGVRLGSCPNEDGPSFRAFYDGAPNPDIPAGI